MDRLDLSAKLHEFCDNVYFQPPESVRLKFPCIIYEKTGAHQTYADDYPYEFDWRYLITVIDADPDSKLPEEVAKLQKCKLDRHFSSDNLYHTTFTLY